LLVSLEHFALVEEDPWGGCDAMEKIRDAGGSSRYFGSMHW